MEIVWIFIKDLFDFYHEDRCCIELYGRLIDCLQ